MVSSVISEVKITFRNPKISWDIFNLKAFTTLFSWPQLLRIVTKNYANLTLGCWKKIINKFPTLPPRGGVSELGKIPYFFFFLKPSLTQLRLDQKCNHIILTILFWSPGSLPVRLISRPPSPASPRRREQQRQRPPLQRLQRPKEEHEARSETL